LSLSTGPRATPDWLITHSFEELDAGVLKSGKEAEVFLVERRSAAGSCLLAHKRYRPRYPQKGELQELGFSKGTIYRADAVYQAGWPLPRRERLALRQGSRFGEHLAAAIWPVNEMTMLERAWAAGAAVPFPVERTDDGLLMEYLGDRDGAAHQLATASLDRRQAVDAAGQLVDSLHALASAGIVHADLSAYNILWWQERLVIIDFPQAVDALSNPAAADLLHRDLLNIAAWFARQRVELDVEALLVELLGLLFSGPVKANMLMR
jgi:RIO kinase 1